MGCKIGFFNLLYSLYKRSQNRLLLLHVCVLNGLPCLYFLKKLLHLVDMVSISTLHDQQCMLSHLFLAQGHQDKQNTYA